MFKNVLKLKEAQKLSKTEQKRIKGGHDFDCLVYCLYDDMGSIGCLPTEHCVPYDCGGPRPGYRCELI